MRVHTPARFASVLFALALALPGADAFGQTRGSTGKIYTPLDDPLSPSFAEPAPSPYDPFNELERFQRRMDAYVSRTFESFGASVTDPAPVAPAFPGARQFAFPSGQMASQGMSLRDEGNRYVVEVTVQEQEMENLQVNVDGRQLRVTGTRNEKTERAEPGLRSRRTVISSFSRSMTLPGPVRAEKMQIDRRKDRVTVTIPKA